MKYMIIGLFLLFAGNIYAQVRGTVKDSTGEAIPGVGDRYNAEQQRQVGR